MPHDFAGWVTKNDLRCSDGVIIRHGAFSSDDGKSVPLVWMHNSSEVGNILGNVTLENRNEGVYGYGKFNNTAQGKTAKEAVQHGDIKSMSIGARKIKRVGDDVVNGSIYEVSLVVAGANPGAFIETSMTHADGSGEEVIIYNDDEITTEEDIEVDKGITELEHEDKTVGEVLKTLSEEQQTAVDFLMNAVLDSVLEDDQEESEGVGEPMKHNLFNNQEDTLTHDAIDFDEVLRHAINSGSTLQDEIKHALGDAGTYGVGNIEVLFPEAKNLDQSGPKFWKDEQTKGAQILAATRKSPFMKLKNQWADLTEKEARARGYIKGNEKLEQVFNIFNRETNGQTIYKKQRLDRDDIIDITDFNIVTYIQSEMKSQLNEEIARAILVGDGRENTDPDKIRQDRIRPIISDIDFFTIKHTFDSSGDVSGLFEEVINAMVAYKGSGQPKMYCDPLILGKLRLLKGTDGRWLFGNRPASNAELADVFGVSEIVPTTLMLNKGFVIVNLNDYTIGTNRGGEITNFSDFDIDFNQYKYLIETRLSGALMQPFSAIYFKDTKSTTSAPLTPGLSTYFNADRKGLKNDLDIQADVDAGQAARKSGEPEVEPEG